MIEPLKVGDIVTGEMEDCCIGGSFRGRVEAVDYAEDGYLLKVTLVESTVTFTEVNQVTFTVLPA